MESIRTVYLPVVVYVPVTDPNIIDVRNEEQNMNKQNIAISKHKSPRKVKKIGQFKPHDQRKSTDSSYKKSTKVDNNINVTETKSIENKGSSYYQTAFISNPCEQLFGPKTIDFNIIESTKTDTIKEQQQQQPITHTNATNQANDYNHAYIPTPKWTKLQTLLLEELYRKSRFPKTTEIKSIAQELKVMDRDIEEWFRKRRGRDRKTRRKNDNLKSLIDNYLDC